MRRVRGFKVAREQRIRVELAGWEGKRVVQLTDLHFGLVTPQALLDAAVQTANALNPDLVVLTGDFVCRGKRHIDQIPETLSALSAPSYAVLGNHDHWVDAVRVRQALERANIVVLQNQWVTHDFGGESLAIVGMDDSTTDHADPHKATLGLNRPALGLTHNPSAAEHLWERGVTGVLSGHTHAGQIHIRGVTQAVYEGVLRQRHVHGLCVEEPGWVYVSPGIGSAAIPWRVGREARREVSHLCFGASTGPAVM